MIVACVLTLKEIESVWCFCYSIWIKLILRKDAEFCKNKNKALFFKFQALLDSRMGLISSW
jgi:hypothetical protein